MLKNDSIKYLDEFVRLSEIGNYLYAADELYISESNLSKHIKYLENQIGHELFRRIGHKLELTEFGELFLKYAKDFLKLDHEYTQAEINYVKESSNAVQIAVARSMNCDHIVNMLSDHFTEKYPNYRISPGEFSRTVSLSQTFQLGYELAFSLDDTPTSKDYTCLPWSSDHLVAVLPAAHPLAAREFLTITDLKEESFIMFPEGTFLNRISKKLCQEAGYDPHIDFTIHGSHNIAELVSKGVGISLTTSSDVLTLKHFDVVTVPLKPKKVVYLNLYYQKDRPLSKVARTFLEYAIYIHDNHYEDIPFMGPEGNVANVYFE